jgi:hypothetical protein
MMFASDFAGPLGFFLSALLALVLVAAWVILAGSRFVQGGVVERPERVPQLYGYTACLIGLIWALASTVALIDNLLAFSAPEMRRDGMFGMEPSVTSFEAFRLTQDRTRQFGGSEATIRFDSVPDTELRRRYEALRADRIRQGQFEARRQIIINGLSLAIALALFVFHWRWVQRRTFAPTVSPPPLA